MAFLIANFQPIGGQGKRGKAPQLWGYWTTDAATTIDGAGYFNAATNFGGAYHLINLGDIIFAVIWTTAVETGTVTDAGVFIVNGKTAAGVIDVTNAVDLFVTDAD